MDSTDPDPSASTSNDQTQQAIENNSLVPATAIDKVPKQPQPDDASNSAHPSIQPPTSIAHQPLQETSYRSVTTQTTFPPAERSARRHRRHLRRAERAALPAIPHDAFMSGALPPSRTAPESPHRPRTPRPNTGTTGLGRHAPGWGEVSTDTHDYGSTSVGSLGRNAPGWSSNGGSCGYGSRRRFSSTAGQAGVGVRVHPAGMGRRGVVIGLGVGEGGIMGMVGGILFSNASSPKVPLMTPLLPSHLLDVASMLRFKPLVPPHPSNMMLASSDILSSPKRMKVPMECHRPCQIPVKTESEWSLAYIPSIVVVTPASFNFRVKGQLSSINGSKARCFLRASHNDCLTVPLQQSTVSSRRRRCE
ncbi:hypothetical protein BJ508DRAFT_314543 [Ascobolus immersus RN42]|uniref:Uncharacterized protein n=1 Tax=Ascobolus immersus RN42 TaxID=1160509 RepID=A0A3N4HEM8_ASCIM|nr:hypothetical protein BJ508DRAFT_314543 [Ascobolus immersus RN42]